MDSNQSKIAVANAALVKCAVAIITTFTANSRPAITMNAVYDQLLDWCLSQHAWTFAKKTTALAVLDIVVPDFGDGVNIAYAYPSDWVKPNEWNFPKANIRMESTGILCDTAGLMVKYTFHNDNPATYSPEFIEFLATKLAAEICFDLTNNPTKTVELAEEVKEKMMQAVSADSQNDTPKQAIQDEWQIARLAGAQGGTTLPGEVSFFSTGPIA